MNWKDRLVDGAIYLGFGLVKAVLFGVGLGIALLVANQVVKYGKGYL